ncbi:hypothetical protein SARC_04940 [Sphaeroforma arctica JP610]|uniref:Annexin n=1 Tax=Sphaeroforma arctica JP610 TaxID=667725 RepID=A0A0L0G0Y7_9EUKA|nr:hypothetical protein SARC_04940 [Sphaeroforma arctica JP610]KNC82782.1 hypothetical protein SARC_04940 [Sphaeroforma arctica JP610]|eukprot:XP_014156684.1 hypothetical protein SARC_04940 [Sphaeroforma arctica JP610]
MQGTDEKALIHVLCNRTNAQRQQIKATYATNVVGRNLEKDLRSETSGGFWETLKAMMMTPAGYDAKTLYKAIDGAGTAEEDIIEILATRSPVELEKIKAEYLRVHKKNLDSEIKKDTSGHFEKACVALLDTNQRKHTFAKPADQQTALAEATRLFKAGEGKTGTDEQTFINVLCFASPLQITLIAQEYLKLCPKYTLEASIDREFSGDIRKLLKSIVRFGVNGPYFFASVLHKSMDGIGTTEPTLIRVMVTRAEVDMEDIKLSYKQAYKTDLAKDIKGEIGGDFEKIMLALCK